MPLVAHAIDADRELFARELDSFVPEQVFDAHAHLWAKSHLPSTAGAAFSQIDDDPINLAVYRRRMAELMPGREIIGGIFLPGAVGAFGDQANAQDEFLATEVAKEKRAGGSMMVSPGMDPEFVRQQVRRLGLTGLKCYHLQSAKQPTWDAELPDYLPESHVKVAHDEGLHITLHMVKSRAIAEPSNQHWIRHYCEKYPDMKMILAHAARGFNVYHTIEGLSALKGLPNLWCDMAAVTEVGACEAIIEILGHDRLLYGTDFPISHLRGRCVVIGDGFLWLYDDSLDWSKVSHEPLQPVLVGLESLRILKQAAWHRRLSDRQVEDIFRNNGLRLLGKA